MTDTHQIDKRGYANAAKNLRRLGDFWIVLGLAFLALHISVLLDTPKVFSVDAITEDDFTNRSDQAILTGTLQVRATRLDLEEATELGTTLTGGQTLTVLSPFTGEAWVMGDPIPVIITSPLISGVRPDTTQVAARPYMNELQTRPDNMLVTRLPDDMQAMLRIEQANIDGITGETIFVWPDHVTATELGNRAPEGSIFRPLAILAFAFCFIAASVFCGRKARGV